MSKGKDRIAKRIQTVLSFSSVSVKQVHDVCQSNNDIPAPNNLFKKDFVKGRHWILKKIAIFKPETAEKKSLTLPTLSEIHTPQ